MDADAGVVRNLTQGGEFKVAPIPPFMQQLIADGGLMAHIAKKETVPHDRVTGSVRTRRTNVLSSLPRS